MEASQALQKLRVGSVLVTDTTGRLESIFTLPRLGDVVTAKPVVISPECSANETLQVMWDCGFRHLPVLDVNRVVGSVSRDDFNDREKVRHLDEREFWEQMR